MSTDATWKAGDRAVCIKRDKWHFSERDSEVCFNCARPQYGVTYLVVAVDTTTRQGVVGLILADMPTQVKYNAKNFRKVVPACDREAVGRENQSLSEQQH